LILDNFDTVEDKTVLAFVRELPAPTKVIITTRNRIDVAFAVRLTGMPVEDAQKLISQECTKRRISLTEDQVQRLYHHTGGIPLAVVWSVAQMGRGYPPEHVLRKLATPSNDVTQYCFETQLSLIQGKPTFQLLTALAMFVTDASGEALGEVADLGEMDRDVGLVELEDLSLVNKDGKRYNLLPLVKGYIGMQIDPQSDLYRQLIQRYVAYFVKHSKRYGGENLQPYYILDADLANIQAAINFAYHEQLWEFLNELVYAVMQYLDHRDLWRELLEYSRMAVEAATMLNDKASIARYKVFGLGWVRAIRLGLVEQGYREILEGKLIAEEVGDQRGYAMALRNEGLVLIEMRELDKARRCLLESTDIWREINDLRWEARNYVSLGRLEMQAGCLDAASKHYKRALELAQAEGDSYVYAASARHLGMIHSRQGDYDIARKYLNEAVDISVSLSNYQETTYSYITLVEAGLRSGFIEEARFNLKKAEEMATRYGLNRYWAHIVELKAELQSKAT
jgi:LuxR family glucitol operon transcriptional activator